MPANIRTYLHLRGHGGSAWSVVGEYELGSFPDQWAGVESTLIQYPATDDIAVNEPATVDGHKTIANNLFKRRTENGISEHP